MLIERATEKFIKSKSQVLLFFDNEQEYLDEAREYANTDFDLVWVENNYFKIKYDINRHLSDRKILLYHPFACPRNLHQYPLSNFLFSYPRLLINEADEILTQFGIHHSHAPLLLRYKKYLKSKAYRDKLLPILSKKPFQEDIFLDYILSFVLRENKTGDARFNLINVFTKTTGGEEVWTKEKKKIEKAGLTDHLLLSCERIIGFPLRDLEYASLKSVFLKLKYNLVTQDLPLAKDDAYARLKTQDLMITMNAKAFISEWMDNKNTAPYWEMVSEHLGAEVDEKKILDVYGIDAGYALMTSKMVDEIIEQITPSALTEPDRVLKLDIDSMLEIQPRKSDELKFLSLVARYGDLLNSYSDFSFNKCEDFLKEYQNSLYKIDWFYREAYLAYQKIKNNHEESEARVFKDLCRSYDQYLIDLNKAWMEVLVGIDFDYDRIETSKQFNFYRDFIADNDNRQVVIISDAFRYELGFDLIERLKINGDIQLSISGMLASIPSYTNLGMSNLLPHKTIKAETEKDTVNYSIEGIITGSANREKILQLFNEKSAAISYSDFTRSGMDLTSQRAFLKDNKVVYIYHNLVDAIGDRKGTEYNTFESVELCVGQLADLIERLYKSLNTYNIYVTADHGFLFNYNEIKENSRQESPLLINTLKEHTRFYLTSEQENFKDTYTFPLSATTDIISDVQVVIPKNINRFRKKGNFGVQFVHGGCSLQELIVPVVEIVKTRSNKIEEVTIKRLDNISVLTSALGIFKIIQNQPANDQFKPATIYMGLYDLNGKLISQEEKIILNRISEKPSDRVFEVRLTLTPDGARANVAHLQAFNAKDQDRLSPIFSDMIKINTLGEIDEF